MSVANISSIVGPSKYVRGRHAIPVLLRNRYFLYPNDPLIIAFTETWLTSSIDDAEIFLLESKWSAAESVLFLPKPPCLLFKETQIFLLLLFVLQAIRHVATAPGKCLILGDFNAPAADWSNRTGPKSGGLDKNLLTTADEEYLYQFIKQSGCSCWTLFSLNFPTQF